MLNQPRYAGAGILLARENFGCGSSREHAPWALTISASAVIAPSFADIFYNNSFKNGLLPVVLDEALVDELFRLAGGETKLGSRSTCTSGTAPGRARPGSAPIEIDPFHPRIA